MRRGGLDHLGLARRQPRRQPAVDVAPRRDSGFGAAARQGRRAAERRCPPRRRPPRGDRGRRSGNRSCTDAASWRIRRRAPPPSGARKNRRERPGQGAPAGFAQRGGVRARPSAADPAQQRRELAQRGNRFRRRRRARPVEQARAQHFARALGQQAPGSRSPAPAVRPRRARRWIARPGRARTGVPPAPPLPPACAR